MTQERDPNELPIEQHYKVSQVARRLQVHPLTVRRWIKDGKMKAVRLGPTGRDVRIPESAIHGFLKDAQPSPVKTVDLKGKSPNQKRSRNKAK